MGIGAIAYPPQILRPELIFYRPDVQLAGTSPVFADIQAAGWFVGCRGIGRGTDGSVWWMWHDGSTVEAIELTYGGWDIIFIENFEHPTWVGEWVDPTIPEFFEDFEGASWVGDWVLPTISVFFEDFESW